MGKIKKYFIITGLLIILIGFLYELIFAGAPSQDAPIPVIIKQIQQHKTADIIMRVGLVILIVGITLNLIYFIRKVNTK